MTISGRVIHGNSVGRTLGFPTANIAVPEGAIIAENGVYAAMVTTPDGKKHAAMINLGVKPTFRDGGARMLEVHLLDFEGDLYGRELSVELREFIRPEQKFATPAELKAQIAKDEIEARRSLCDITFLRLTDTRHPFFGEAWRLYLKSFPPQERRRLPTQKKIMDTPPYHFELALEVGSMIGFVLWWGFDDVRYIEHLATFPHLRGKGHGARILKKFIEADDTPVLLEVEPPTDDISRRRVGFYERAGFVFNDHDYSHPPYKKGGERVRLMIMTYPAAITKSEMRRFVKKYHPVIHKNTI